MTTKRILVVSLDLELGRTRSLLLQAQGYKIDCAASDDDAMRMLESMNFYLVLLGRDSLLFEKRLDQRIRQKYPKQLTLKIQPVEETVSLYASRTVDSVPSHVIEALREMLPNR
jgi:DNA-binding NtrC family response regulator